MCPAVYLMVRSSARLEILVCQDQGALDMGMLTVGYRHPLSQVFSVSLCSETDDPEATATFEGVKYVTVLQSLPNP